MYGGEIMNVFGITEKSIGFLISMFDKYHTDENYQALMKAKNAKAHSKDNMEDYERHRSQEIKRRVERWGRNPKLRAWHYEVSARNEKRTPRKTSLGRIVERK